MGKAGDRAILSKRAGSVLKFIVENYITTNAPVSSAMICSSKEFLFSPATVRNVMAELETSGFLSKPYHSAARVPTEKAYRFFVDNLMDSAQLNKKAKRIILENIFQYRGGLEGLLSNTSRLLSELSSWIGVVLPPRFEETKLQHITFVKLDSRSILVILISQSAVVKSSEIHLDESYSEKELDQAAHYINQRFSGFSLVEMGSVLLKEIQKERTFYDRVARIIFELNHKYFLERTRSEAIYTGLTSDFFDKQTAESFKKLKSLHKALEEKRKLARLLIECMGQEGIRIWIGSENPAFKSSELSLVASNYTYNDRVIGSLGVVGPIWMNYPEACTVVHNVAKYFGEKLASDSLS
jgi:heat-inducible transcriptional repressor